MAAFGPLATDMYLPAFPAIAGALPADPAAVQVTLATYFAGTALGQLGYGPFSDRFGRRPALLLGLLVFTLASVGCALTRDIDALTWLRFAQGLGGCAGNGGGACHRARRDRGDRLRAPDVAADAGDGAGADPGALARRRAAGGGRLAGDLLGPCRLQRGPRRRGAPSAAGNARARASSARGCPGHPGDLWAPAAEPDVPRACAGRCAADGRPVRLHRRVRPSCTCSFSRSRPNAMPCSSG